MHVRSKRIFVHVVFSVPKNYLSVFNHVLELIERKSKARVVKVYGEEA